MAVIDGVFCLGARVIGYKREMLSVVVSKLSKTISTYNTPDTTVTTK